MTTATAAVHFGVSERAIRNRCMSGSLDAAKRDGRWLIHLEVAE